MRGTRLARYLGAATFSACLLISGSATAFNGTVLRGFGTATIDGVMGAGEWDSAGRVDFTVNRSTSQGGGTVPATVYAMNDATNLYVGIKVTNATVGSSGAELFFDSDHNDSEVGEGEDSISVDGTGAFHDRFYRFDSPGWWLSEDTDYGGTDDGDERDADAIGFSFYEFSHPLDDADNAHDFSLAAVRAIGFKLRFRHCSPCAPHSYFPPSGGLAEIMIVSGSRVAPDTQLTAGPAEGSMNRYGGSSFEFTGSDDVLQSSQLTFECKVNEDSWRTCTSPHRLGGMDDGRHTFSVRAVDEMLNVDQSPAQRNWTVDTTGPSKPVIRGRRSVREGQKVVLRFSATDAIVGGVHFRCAADSTRLRKCSAVFKVKLRPGRHVVRVRALDRLGNQSDLGTFRIKVKRAKR